MSADAALGISGPASYGSTCITVAAATRGRRLTQT